MSNQAPADYRRKMLSPTELAAVVAAARDRGETVVHCHGCFDILHPGHIRHLTWARQQGDMLIVSVTADAYVSKGPGRPFIREELRAEHLAALEMVNHVTISQDRTAVPMLELLRPDLYVKGKEAETDQSEGMRAERETVQRLGGRVIYSPGEVILSSTRLGALAIAELAEASRPTLASLTVVVGALNEEESLAHTLDEIRDEVGRLAEEYEVLIYNDGSTDRTGEIADDYQQRYPEMVAIHNETNRGLGWVYHDGMARARCEWLTMIHADGQLPPGELRKMLPLTTENDIVLGYSTSLESRPWRRRAMSRGYHLVMRLLFGTRFRYLNGLTLYRVSKVRGLRQVCYGHAFHAEVVVRGLRAGLRVAETQIEDRARYAGQEKAASLAKVTEALREVRALHRDVRGSDDG